MKVDIQNAFKYNKIYIVKRCINKNIRYVGEYQLQFKQSTKEFNNLINVCPEVNLNLNDKVQTSSVQC